MSFDFNNSSNNEPIDIKQDIQKSCGLSQSFTYGYDYQHYYDTSYEDNDHVESTVFDHSSSRFPHSQSVPDDFFLFEITDHNDNETLDRYLFQHKQAKEDSFVFKKQVGDFNVEQDQPIVAFNDNTYDKEWHELANNVFDCGPTVNLWEELHQQEHYINIIKTNSFVHLILQCQLSPLKVTHLHKAIHYKQIQNHFFNPSILFIRHLRYYHCVYVVYKSYEEMIKAWQHFDLSTIDGYSIHCHPSSMEELEHDFLIDVERRLSCKKRVFNKKYDTFIPNYQHIDQNIYYHSQYQREQEPAKYYYNIPQSPTQYVIIKIRDRQDIKLSREFNYLNIHPDRIVFLNQIFNSCNETYLLISVNRSKKYQGYVKMMSEVIDIDKISNTEDLPFTSSAYHWKYVCRIEWVTITSVSIKDIGHLINNWNHNERIKYATNITLIEPTIGKRIVDLMLIKKYT